MEEWEQKKVEDLEQAGDFWWPEGTSVSPEDEQKAERCWRKAGDVRARRYVSLAVVLLGGAEKEETG